MFQLFTAVGHIANPSWCLLVITMYFCPAAFAVDTTALASKLDGLKVLAFASYSGHGMLQFRLIHSASRQVAPFAVYSPRNALYSPKWMNMPNRLSRHHWVRAEVNTSSGAKLSPGAATAEMEFGAAPAGGAAITPASTVVQAATKTVSRRTRISPSSWSTPGRESPLLVGSGVTRPDDQRRVVAGPSPGSVKALRGTRVDQPPRRVQPPLLSRSTGTRGHCHRRAVGRGWACRPCRPQGGEGRGQHSSGRRQAFRQAGDRPVTPEPPVLVRRAMAVPEDRSGAVHVVAVRNVNAAPAAHPGHRAEVERLEREIDRAGRARV